MGATKSKESDRPSKKSSTDLSRLEARVDKVHISGLGRTHDDYVRRAVKNMFDAQTLEEVVQATMETKANLSELGIFKGTSVIIDTSKGEKATPNGYEITFQGEEYPRVTGSVGTEIGQNEGAATVEMAAPNIWGRGERFSVNGSYSNSKTTDVNLKLSKPFYHTAFGDYKPEISLIMFRNAAMFPWSKYKTTDTGLIVDWSFLMPTFITHSLQYECAIKEISTIGKQVPFFVRENCGPRLASLVRHICSYDERDSPVFPTEGFHARSTFEASGFGGNVSFMKSNTHIEYNVPLFAGISTQFCGRVGLIHQKTPDLPISNKFVIGGPFTIRGFRPGGAGSHVEGTATGNTTYWITGAHLWTPLPFSRYFKFFGDHLKVHLFANAGNVDSFETTTCRTSVGAGLAFRLGNRARIELNYCKPIHKQPGDFANREGFQFGIGYEFT